MIINGINDCLCESNPTFDVWISSWARRIPKKSGFPATFTIISGPDVHLFMVKSPFLVVGPQSSSPANPQPISRINIEKPVINLLKTMNSIESMWLCLKIGYPDTPESTGSSGSSSFPD